MSSPAYATNHTGSQGVGDGKKGSIKVLSQQSRGQRATDRSALGLGEAGEQWTQCPGPWGGRRATDQRALGLGWPEDDGTQCPGPWGGPRAMYPSDGDGDHLLMWPPHTSTMRFSFLPYCTVGVPLIHFCFNLFCFESGSRYVALSYP